MKPYNERIDGIASNLKDEMYSLYMQGYKQGRKEALEQEPVLDKVRAEIEQITDTMGVSYNQYVSKIDVLQIIDKYSESEGEE